MKNQKNDSATIVLFGATGDLAKRKLIPGLYNIMIHGNIQTKIKLIAIGRKPYTDVREEGNSYKAVLEESIRKYSREGFDSKYFEVFCDAIQYHRMDMASGQDYPSLKRKLDALDDNGNRVYYLATSARFFETITDFLAENQMHTSENGWQRVVIEKPFGSDLETAKRLNDSIKAHFDEGQIYRIDHYLAKEMTQNILMLRGKNAVFNAVWNNDFIDHIQITVSEDMGVENRAKYYDQSGAMRDMIQNHLLQIVALTTMRFCDINDTEAVRDAKSLIFKSLKPYSHEDLHKHVILGQYKGYRDIDSVATDSLTETYVAMKLEVDLHEWSGVPIYLRTGKRLKRKEAYVMIEFKKGRFCRPEGDEKPNRLIIKIQPEEGVNFHFNVKEPGNSLDVNEVKMDFCQTCDINYNTPEAYESLLMDALKGDQARFTRWDEVESAWAFTDQIVKHHEDRSNWLEFYDQESDGPSGAKALIEQDGRTWWENI